MQKTPTETEGSATGVPDEVGRGHRVAAVRALRLAGEAYMGALRH